MNEPNMHSRHKTGAAICEALRRLANFPMPGGMASTGPKPCRTAAFRRRALMAMLLLPWIDSPGTGRGLAGSADKASVGSRTADHVDVAARRAGDAVLVTLRIDPGYHINANPPSHAFLIPTTLAFDGLVPERIAYPPATTFKPVFADEPIAVYEDTVTVAASFPPDVLDKVHELRFVLTAQACTEQICLPPDDIVDRARW